MVEKNALSGWGQGIETQPVRFNSTLNIAALWKGPYKGPSA